MVRAFACHINGVSILKRAGIPEIHFFTSIDMFNLMKELFLNFFSNISLNIAICSIFLTFFLS